MNHNMHRIGIVIVLLVLTAIPTMPQNINKMTIASPDQAGVSLRLLPETATPTSFEKLFQSDADMARLRPFSLLLTNASEKDIIGLTLQWTVADPAGKQRVLNYRTDSLFPSRSDPVVHAGETALVTPSAVLRESLLRSGSGFISASKEQIKSDAARFEESSAISVDVDAVIFGDGEVVGPDRLDTMAQIEARKSAADAVSSAVSAKLKEGQDPSAMLSEMTKQRVNKQDYFAVWSVRLAQMLLRSPDVKNNAENLSKVPTVRLYRK